MTVSADRAWEGTTIAVTTPRTTPHWPRDDAPAAAGTGAVLDDEAALEFALTAGS